MGPFQIIRKLDTLTYKLALPDHMKIYSVFHAWLLHSYDGKPIAGQSAPKLNDAELDDKDDDTKKYPVEEIVDSRTIKRLDPRTKKQLLL
jgi:hypothetical protein